MTINIYLASKSPRRKDLLHQMEVPFDLLIVDIPEIIKANESSKLYSRRIVAEKLDAAWLKMQSEGLAIKPILCADTEVVLDGNILGKPQDAQNAFSMLKSLSGRTHLVLTSVGIKYLNYEKIMLDKTRVSFANIPDEAIHHYLNMGDYMDKAGAYGIQSYIGQFIKKVDGCFYSVMGLPLNTVRELLEDIKKSL